MSAFSIQLHWQRTEPALQTGACSRAHTVQHGGCHDLPVDAAPDCGGKPAKAGRPEVSHHDHAVAHLDRAPRGKVSETRIELHPVVHFDAGFAVDDATRTDMQDRAHRSCFVADTLADSLAVNIL
jgi:hypothetical protein